ncbi:MAG: hypothetical protein K6T26_08215, partial [Alicyclobacillus sp.]|nr:hypothetical protein [Alicyclobacillus sp.]
FQHSPGIWTGKDVYISKSVTLVPPVVIGNGVQIGPGSTIGPCAVLGDGVVVASGCSIVESVVLPGVQLQGNRAIVRTLVCRNGTVALQPPVDTAQQGVLQR